MVHLGDITKINGAGIKPVDVITFGAPCTDISVAGLRKGMKHESKGDEETTRSGLFYEATRIIREMRNATNGEYPRYAVYENVPGAFSSNNAEDFRCVLEELCKIKDPHAAIPRPAKGKWGNAGAIMGDGWSLAWRVMDSQFWGVPQRRRRIALVFDFGGHSAPEILFVEQGLRGDTAPGGEAGQGTAADAESGIGGADGFGETGIGYWQNGIQTLRAEGENRPSRPSNVICIQGNTVDRNAQQNGSGVSEDVSYTLNTVDRHAVAFMGGQGARAHGIAYMDECAPTIKASSSGSNQVPAVAFTQKRFGEYEEGVGTIVLSGGARKSGETLAVLPFDTTQITSPQNGNNPQYGDPCHPLCATAHVPGVVEKQACWPHVARTLTEQHDSSPCIDRGQNVVCMAHGQANAEIMENVSPTLNCNHEQPIAVHPEISGTLRASGAGMNRPSGMGNETDLVVAKQYRVRRLTPVECERLQNFPDGWTDIPDYTDSKGKTKKVSDSARYKALGNSIALPPWRFVLGQISNHLTKGATLGSLFDGIGGFPLIWEEIHGRGTAVWASEIEEFPIAVTKYWFGEEAAHACK